MEPEPTEFPSNSKINRPIDKRVQKPDDIPKVVEKVVTGKVVQRKKPLGTRLKETFIGGEAKGVGHYVLMEIIVPAIKDVTADAVSQAIEKMLFGEARSTSRRTGQRPATGYTSYNRYSAAAASKPPWNRDEPRPMSRRERATHDFDQIILQTRGEATEVIDRLFDLIARYEQATVADLYELVGISGNFTDEKWGWTDLRGAGVTRVASGYLLDLPKTEPLEH